MAISVPPFIATYPTVYDTGSVPDEGISALRDYMRARSLVWANGHAALWLKTGLTDVIEVPIVLSFDYASFDDHWSSWSTNQDCSTSADITDLYACRDGATRS